MTRYMNRDEFDAMVAGHARRIDPDDSYSLPALTLTQPWATLVMLGEKRIETRHCQFRHRGPLAIHASRIMNGDALMLPSMDDVTARHGDPAFPVGVILGVVDVVDGCRFTDDAWPACIPIQWRHKAAEFEAAFGDYRPGRGGLLLANPRPLVTPIRERGMNGLWPWSFDEPLEFRP